MEYRNLSTSEKIEQVSQYSAYTNDKPYKAAYLDALRKNDRQAVEQYENMGDSPRQIIMNLQTFDRGLIFGFTAKIFNEYGWLENAEFQERETFEFIDRKGWAAHNYITIGRGTNGKWSYGASYSTGGSGGGYGLGVWGKVFDSRKECLAAALRELLDRHAHQRERLKDDSTNFNPTLSNMIVKQVQAMLQETTVAKQLTLFFS